MTDLQYNFTTSNSKRHSVAAMVTLYNSDHDVNVNISTYIEQVDKLYVIDNSDRHNDLLVQLICESYTNVKYINNGGNQGIACALNVAAQAAAREGYEYLLMMDDDSRATEAMVDTMLDYIQRHPEPNKIGIVAAQADPNLFDSKAKVVWYTITAGSLLSLNAFKHCGGFYSELFIDAVDHEYCFRLIKNGYYIISIDYLHLQHKIGELKQLTFFGQTFYKWASHSPIRNYYMLRNFLFVLNKYKSVIPIRTLLLIMYGISKVCLLNSLLEKDTLIRLKYMKKAILDFNSGKLGKYNNIN